MTFKSQPHPPPTPRTYFHLPGPASGRIHSLPQNTPLAEVGTLKSRAYWGRGGSLLRSQQEGLETDCKGSGQSGVSQVGRQELTAIACLTLLEGLSFLSLSL